MSEIVGQFGGAGSEIPEGMNGGDAIVFEQSEDGSWEAEHESGLDGLETVLAMNGLPVPGQEAEEGADEDEDELEDDEDLDDDEDEEDEEDESDEDPEPQPKGKRDKRIKKLVDQKNELQSRVEQMEQQFYSQTQQMLDRQAAQHQEQLQYMARQNEQMQQQLEFLGEGRKREERENLPEIERFKLEMEERAEKRLKPMYKKEVDSLREEIQALKQERAQEKAQKQKKQRLSNMENSAKMVIERDFSHIEDPVQRQLLEDQLIGLSATYGRPPEQVSHLFERFANAFGVKKKSKKQKRTKAPIANARAQLPKSANVKGGSKGSQSGGNYRPDWATLQKNGYRDYHEWRDAGAHMLS